MAAVELSNKYGPVLGLKLGVDRIVVVGNLQGIREFLSSEDLTGRPNGPYFELRTFGYRRGIITSDGELWAEQRRFVVRHLREFGFGRRNMSSMIEDEAELMCQFLRDQISKSPSATIQMDKMCGIHILNTLWMMLAGTRYKPEDMEMTRLQTILGELFKNIDMLGTTFGHYPFLIHVAPEFSGYNLYMQSHEPLWKFIGDEIENHKKTYIPDQNRDLIDVYLGMLNSESRPKTFTEKQLLAVCLDLFMAGSETTTKSFGFSFVYLLLYPEVQAKAQAEIDRIVGRDRLPTLHDRPK